MHRPAAPLAAPLAVRLAALAFAATAPVASAQVTSYALAYDQPFLNRWMYFFASNPAARQEASVFGAIRIQGFDDRDAQFVLGFDTSGQITPGTDPRRFRVLSATVTVTVSQGGRFAYDPTPDPTQSWYAPADPEFVADADTGRPIELFGAGYRGQWGPLTFQQGSPFADATNPAICSPGGFPCTEGNRNVFAADTDLSGAMRDVSRQVRARITDAAPWAVGVTQAVQPGQLVPADTTFALTLDVDRPAVQGYLQRQIAQGRVNLVVTSLHEASGGPGGGTSTAYPVLYTKENPLAQVLGYSPKLAIQVLDIGCYANCDASTTVPVLNALDFSCFLNRYRAGDPYANCDGSTTLPQLNALDFSCFLSRFRAPEAGTFCAP